MRKYFFNNIIISSIPVIKKYVNSFLKGGIVMTQKDDTIKTRLFNESYFAEVYKDNDYDHRPWITGSVDNNILDLMKDGIINKKSKLLDIGCGYGTESIAIALLGADVVGIDINRDALSTAKKIAECYKAPVSFIQCDVLNLPFEDESFNVIVDQGCFHHILPVDRRNYAEQVAKVLCSGGFFALRGFSDWIEPGTSPKSPFRLTSRDLLKTFLPFFECEEIYRFRSLPRKNKTRWFWWSLWKKA